MKTKPKQNKTGLSLFISPVIQRPAATFHNERERCIFIRLMMALAFAEMEDDVDDDVDVDDDADDDDWTTQVSSYGMALRSDGDDRFWYSSRRCRRSISPTTSLE